MTHEPPGSQRIAFPPRNHRLCRAAAICYSGRGWPARPGTGRTASVEHRYAGLDDAVPLQALLGYLNFSEGRPDPRFQKQLTDAYAYLAGHGDSEPWKTLPQRLKAKLAELQGSTGPFRDARQAAAVLALAFDKVLPAYRQHH